MHNTINLHFSVIAFVKQQWNGGIGSAEWYNCFVLLCLFLVSDSTCITPILNAYSSKASQLSDSSTTPTNSYTTAYLTPRSSYSSVTLSDSTSAEFYSIAQELDESNEKTISSIYDTCIEAGSRLKSAVQSSRLLSATRSVQQRLRPLRSYGRLLNNRFMKLQQLSIVRGTQIDIQGDQADEKKDCTCERGHFDGNCLKSFMMSVQAPEYRSTPQMMASNPVVAKDVYDHNIFNVARIKKVELHELAPKVPEFHGKWSSFYFYIKMFLF